MVGHADNDSKHSTGVVRVHAMPRTYLAWLGRYAAMRWFTVVPTQSCMYMDSQVPIMQRCEFKGARKEEKLETTYTGAAYLLPIAPG